METDYGNYENKISQCDQDDLLNLWEAIEAKDTPGWAPGKALEYLVLRAFQLEGAEVRWPYSVKMDEGAVEQIDGVVYSDGLACLVECKDQVEKVNFEPVAKLRNQLLRRPGAAIGMVFSRSEFTRPALTLVQFVAPQTILLWRGEEIKYALQDRCVRKGLVAKYRYCIEHGLSYYNIIWEDSP